MNTWIIRTDATFCPAKRRRTYVRGKRSDRNALFNHRLRNGCDMVWTGSCWQVARNPGGVE